MNGAHDLGGLMGFGPVIVEQDEPNFHDEWEKRVFAASMLGLGDEALGRVDMFRHAIERMEDMPQVAPNSLSVAFGDFSQAYTIVDRMGLRVLRDPFSSKPFVLFYTTKRTGGDVTNFEAFAIQKTAA